MPFELDNFRDGQTQAPEADYLEYLLDRQEDDSRHYRRLWDYFRNPLRPATGAAAGAANSASRPYVEAQEAGLPARITGVRRVGSADDAVDLRRKEVVIENDIAWRIQTMIDFLFPRCPTFRSLAADEQLAATIEQTMAALLEANGGVRLLQEMALYGAVYGFVDVALRTPADAAGHAPAAAIPADSPSRSSASAATAHRPGTPTDRSRLRAVSAAATLRLEPIEAPRVIPLLAEDDYSRLRLWVQKFDKYPPRLDRSHRRRLPLPWRGGKTASPAAVEVVEILSPTWWQRYEDRRLVAEGPNPLGRIPVAHVQNLSLPGGYAGLGDVEPLVPLQDELNTRLSDRAHRVTYQSFKMYLGKGIDDFLERPVGPGQMWATENPAASIEEFGSDADAPGETAHIEQVREAMDKVSGVTPLAAGLIRGNIGHLTSATALRVVLSGLLSRTARKRLTYGAGLAQLAELVLAWLDRRGVLHTRPEDRRVEIHWPSPLPTDEAEQLRNAEIKARLGVPRERILTELGYEDHTDSTDRTNA
ncbi:MAG: phage portal protein [Phycisphaerae bacterium]